MTERERMMESELYWRGIDSAPRDRIHVLLAGTTKMGSGQVRSAYFDVNVNAWLCGVTSTGIGLEIVHPTHWMPLPPAPKPAKGSIPSSEWVKQSNVG